MEIPSTARELMVKIIDKKGLYGRCAKMYIGDPALTEQFLKECYEQCHNQAAVDHWGKELVESIIKFIEKDSLDISHLNEKRIKSFGLPNCKDVLKNGKA